MSDLTSFRNMERRAFAKAIAGGVIGAAVAGSTGMANAAAAPKVRAPRKNTLHRVGGDYHCVLGDHWAGKKNIEFHQRCGVSSLSPSMDAGGDNAAAKGPTPGWNLEEMKRWKDALDKAKMTWDGIRMDSSYIYLKPGEERDRKI